MFRDLSAGNGIVDKHIRRHTLCKLHTGCISAGCGQIKTMLYEHYLDGIAAIVIVVQDGDFLDGYTPFFRHPDIIRCLVVLLYIPWQIDGKNRTVLGSAADDDIAPHHAAKALTYRQSQTGAAVFFGGAGFGLHKRLEYLVALFRCHAYAGIGHFKSKPLLATDHERFC